LFDRPFDDAVHLKTKFRSVKKQNFMSRILFTLLFALLFGGTVCAQGVIQPPAVGFDTLVANIPHGRIDTIIYPSNTVGNDRRALIYTPPGFSKKNKYPVLYLLHGIGGDEKEWLNGGSPQIILDNLYAQHKIEPMIVVLPNGRAMKNDRAEGNIFDSARVQAFANFEKDLLNDLIPWIQKNILCTPIANTGPLQDCRWVAVSRSISDWVT
jgi:hypothetical protein